MFQHEIFTNTGNYYHYSFHNISSSNHTLYVTLLQTRIRDSLDSIDDDRSDNDQPSAKRQRINISTINISSLPDNDILSSQLDFHHQLCFHQWRPLSSGLSFLLRRSTQELISYRIKQHQHHHLHYLSASELYEHYQTVCRHVQAE